MLVFRPNVDLSGFGVSVALVAGAILLMLLLEPLCLHLFGTTPGKALLGLHIERPDGGRLGYGEAARRTFDVLTYGLGFHVPILSQVLLICSWLRHRDGRPLRWEAGSELRLDKKRLGLLTVGYILPACLASFTGFVNEELSQMPKNRGDITAAEFCENYNGLAHMDGYLRSYISLTPEGWERTSMNPTRLEVQGYEAEYSFYETGGVLERLELRLEKIPGRTGQGEGGSLDDSGAGGFQAGAALGRRYPRVGRQPRLLGRAADDHRAGLNPQRRQNGAHHSMRSVYCCPFQPISRPEAGTMAPSASDALKLTRSPMFRMAASGLSAALRL